jgi:hypothetical protein
VGELIMPTIEVPEIRDDWEYDESVALVRPVLGRWKTEAKELILPELWNAHQHLDGRGGDRGNQYTGGKVAKDANASFATYCTAVGFSYDTGRRWLIEANLLVESVARVD